MSGLKTILALTLLVATDVSSASRAVALPSHQDQLRIFATCAGRLSAQMEFEWMFDGPKSEVTKASRASLIDMLEALTAPDQGAKVLGWQIDAKMAQAALLTRATFGTKPRDAKIAHRMALQLIGQCRSLLLS